MTFAMNKVPWTIVVCAKRTRWGDVQVKVFGSDDALVIPQSDLVTRAVEAGKLPV